MKKLIAFLTLVIFISLPSLTTYAKSYTIDDVQIRGWVQPNGDIFVNEIFTYTLDGQFTEFTRSFPKRHVNQIDEFGASTMSVERPVVGYLSEDIFTPREVRKEGETYIASVHAGNKTVSIFYKYYLRNAVKSYDTYSDIDILYFEKGSNHNIDFNNVHISYVLPGAVGDSNIHGFMHDRHWNVHEIYEDYVVFETEKSQAYMETSTRVFFPSSIMTEQKKGEASVSLERAIELEKKKLETMTMKLSFIPKIEKIIWIVGIVFLILGMIIFFLYRQRWFSLFGHRDLVMQTDPVYLFFVDRSGEWHSKSFLAGLFSIVEKGYANVMIEPSAERFKKDPSAPENTLAFELIRSNESLSSHEQKLVSWLFQSGTGNRKFNLHDVAGASQGERTKKKLYEKKQYKFELDFQEWYDEVKRLLNEAGTFSKRISQVIKAGVIICLTVCIGAAFYAELGTESKIVGPLIFGALALATVIGKRQQLLFTCFFFGVMTFMSFQIHDETLSGGILFLVLMGALLYFVTPSSFLTSLNALQTKMSIIKFRRQVKDGIPADLSREEQSLWLARAYLLNRSESFLPFIKGDLPATLPLAALFTMTDDPLHFVTSTWGPSRVFSTRAEDSRNYNSGGGFSGGGGSGGGGAGAR